MEALKAAHEDSRVVAPFRQRLSTAKYRAMAESMTAQGFGHQGEIVRAFADYVRETNPDGAVVLDVYARDYLSTLAAKPDAKENANG